MGVKLSYQSESDPLTSIFVRRPEDAYGSQAELDRQWSALNYVSCPKFDLALKEFSRLERILIEQDIDVKFVKGGKDLNADSIYVRDASVLSDKGAILCRMGKDARKGEPSLMHKTYQALGIPILGEIEAPGKLEGGDTLWLDQETLCVGLGYRTNSDGIRQLRELLGPGIEVIEVDLPHFRGPSDVFHLMSIISPIDRDMALVYSPLMPVRFRNKLLDRQIRLIELPEDEFDSIGGNVLSLGNQKCLMLDGNPRTKSLLEEAGIEVLTYIGEEISIKGMGGPTCLTRPLLRTVSNGH